MLLKSKLRQALRKEPLGAKAGDRKGGQDVQQNGADVSKRDGQLQVVARLDLGVSQAPGDPALGDAGTNVDGGCRVVNTQNRNGTLK